jgi:hypothetical protein
MPPLANPSRSLSVRMLDSLWNNPELEDHFSYAMDEVRLALPVLCVRNPGAASIAFLRAHSADHPAVLLGLALAEPLRYARQIEKAFLAAPQSPAAVLAIIVAKGVEDGVEFLNSAAPAFPGKGRLVDAAVGLHRAVQTLDWAECARLTGELQGWDIKPCLPLVMSRLWSCLGPSASVLAVGDFSVEESAKFLANVGVDLFGLCLALGERFPDAEEQQQALRKTLLDIFRGASRWTLPGELKLWLHLVTGERLYDAAAVQSDDNSLTFGDDIHSSAAYRLFFTETGERRIVADLPWSGHGEIPAVSPSSARQIRQFAEFLVEKTKPEDRNKSYFHKPALALEDRLLDYFLEEKQQDP